MSRAWQSSVSDERPVVPRPGALLTAAAAVPLGGAVLLAAGLLPAGARIALGAALAVLGWRVRDEASTALGARVGAPALRGIGLAALVLGLVLVAGGAAVVLVDLAGESIAEGFEETGLGAGASATAAALVAGAGVATAVVASPRIGALVAGVGAALLLSALLAVDAVDAAGGTRAVVLLLAAVLAAAEGLRRGEGDDVGRGLLVAAGVLVALTRGEATELLSTVAGAVIPLTAAPGSAAGRGAQAAVGAALAAVLLVAAVRRRDAVVGVLPLGVLLLGQNVEGTAEEAGLLLVPALATLGLVATLAGAGPLRERFDRDALRAALAVAVLVLLDVAAAVLPRGSDGNLFSSDDVSVLALVLAAVSAGVLLLVVVLARATEGRAGAGLGIVVLVALLAASPFETIQQAGPESWGGSVVVAAVASLLAVALGAAVVHRRQEPLVVGAAALLLASSVARVVQTAAFRGDLDGDGPLTALLAAQLAPAVLLAVAAGTVALLGGPAVLARAQAAGAALLYLAALGAAGATRIVLAFGSGGSGQDDQALDGAPLVVAVALLLLLAVAAALLAASTARRRSPVVAVAGVGVVLAVAVYTAAIGAAAGDQGASPDDPSGLLTAPQPAGLALGLRTLAPLARDVGAGWPILLGLLGAALLGAAWWLESRRPAPAGAPVG